MYEITEENITYHLTLEQTVLLKQYFHDHAHEKPTPESWYYSLSKEEKKKVLRTGVQENTEYIYKIELIHTIETLSSI